MVITQTQIRNSYINAQLNMTNAIRGIFVRLEGNGRTRVGRHCHYDIQKDRECSCDTNTKTGTATGNHS
jgi:hypothetical protein